MSNYFKRDEKRALNLVNARLADHLHAWISHAVDHHAMAKRPGYTEAFVARCEGIARAYALCAIDALRAMLGVDAAGRIIERLKLHEI